MRSLRLSQLLVILVGCAPFAAVACSDDPSNPGTSTSSSSASGSGGSGGAGGAGGAGGVGGGSSSTGTPGLACADALLPLQNPRAHTLGETFYLPRFLTDPGCPAELAWQVVSAPADSKNAVYNTGAPEPRFTPDVPGDYTFRLNDPAQTELTLRAVARTSQARFRNHHLTPLYGAAAVDGELWTANGASYTVTRLVADNGQWKKDGEITVGAWPAAIAHHAGGKKVYVAQRGSDTVGIVDRDRNVLEDALWVGDEPSGLAISPDGTTLYVSLATMRKVAVVDLDKREVKGTIPVGFDPRALTLSADGKRLFVASYRSGNKIKDTRGTYGPGDDEDIWIVDTETQKVSLAISGVAADLRSISLSEDGSELYVAATDGDPEPSQSAPNAMPFFHEVVVLGADPAKPDYGTVLRRADLTRQSGSGGAVVNPSGVLGVGDTIWVSSESSDVVVALDRATLAEKARTAVGPGARALVKIGNEVAVHSYQSFEASFLDAAGAVVQTVALAEDPRPTNVALGERVFTRPGGTFAANHACSSCHVETQNDGMVWRFGPQIWHNVRPLQLLDATTPLEWGAYVSNADNFGYQGPSSIVGRPATPEEALGLQAFLGSLLGAPRETGHTRVDGSFTEAALRGKDIFEGKAACYGCHAPPLYTSREYIPVGKSGEPADIPSLLGVYRHGVYFVKGQGRSLEAALDVAVNYVQADLTADEKADLLQFLRELTPKGAHPLAIWPDIDSDEAVYPDIRPSIAFADPIDDSQPGKTAADVAADYVILETEAGEKVSGSIVVTGGRAEFVPTAPLTAGAKYRFRVLPGLPFLSGGATSGERSTEFVVANPAIGTWPKTMKMTVTVPGPGGVMTPLDYVLEASDTPRPGGMTLMVKPQLFGNQQRQEVWARLDGDKLYMQPVAMPINPTGVADAAMIVGTVKTVNQADKSISLVEGTLRLGGPGINIPGVAFAIVPN
ncbi:YncE family protein [Polyangium jinanense]|uniref:Beta-propeller fold lactonase family protein n=1 Tax=Polyangium jinanense TaxID=2829994 RepID=A0A9X4ATQ4_9BACT|nr:YncE family protein [Polyangium jinanense]MDC3983781.1 beta-propeller fold lactonase family protein [Polyangium jinanense]